MIEPTSELDLHQSNFDRLVKAVRSGVSIVPFVGAGLSNPYGLPTWSRFLINLAKQANVEASVQEQLGAGAYELAAETVRDAMSDLVFADAIHDTFSVDKIKWPAASTVVDILATLPPGTVITTNFDRILEEVFASAGRSFERVVWGVTEDTVIRALTNDAHVLVKLHGDVADRQNRVLTLEDYDRQYGAELGEGNQPTPVATYLRQLIQTRTLLFLGCSLDADRTVQQLTTAAARQEATVHYTIQAKPPDPTEEAEQTRVFGTMGIRVIWVPSGRHDLIESMLNQIMVMANTARRQSTSALAWAPEFFRSTQDASALLRHDWPLVGRQEILNDLHAWIDDATTSVAILPGPGGIGKTRLLYQVATEWKDKHPGSSLRFRTGAAWNACSIHLTPGKNVLVVDDAHRSASVRDILAFAYMATTSIKILLTTRPFSLDHLLEETRHAGFDLRDVKIFSRLQPLLSEDRHTLAREVLGPNVNEAIVHRLAGISRDAPVVATIGGVLVRERRIDPATLPTDREFEDAIRRGFRDTAEGAVGPIPHGVGVRRVLDAVAATSPVRLDNEPYIAALAEWIHLRPSETRQVLTRLEEGGILGQREATLHIAPEVLADFMLEDACLDARGLSSGYATEIFDHFRYICPDSIITNLSLLNWRIRIGGDELIDSQLFSGIWDRLTSEFKGGANEVRISVLRLVRELAHTQSDRGLTFVEMALRLEIDSVLEVELPSVLAPLSTVPSTRARAIELLWELGRDDPRSPDQNPEHAIRILQDLAGCELGRPFELSEPVIRAAAGWLSRPDAHTHKHDPLDIVAKALRVSGTSTFTEGPRIMLHPFVVSAEATRAIREIAISAVGGEFFKLDDRAVRRACAIAIGALRELMPGHPDGIPDDQISDWAADIDRLFAIIESAIQSGSLIAKLCLGTELAWFGDQGKPDWIRKRVQEIMSGIMLTPDLQLYAALANGCDLWPNEDGTFAFNRWETRSGKRLRIMSEVLTTLHSVHQTRQDLAAAIDQALVILKRSEINLQPMDVFTTVANHDPELLGTLLDRALAPAESALSAWSGSLVYELFRINPDAARIRMHQLLEAGNIETIRPVAMWGRICSLAATDQDLELIGRLLSLQDQTVRAITFDSLSALLPTNADPVLAMLLRESENGDDAAVVVLAEVVGQLSNFYTLPIEESIIARALPCLGRLSSLDDYWVQRFVSLAYQADPESTITMLITRLLAWANQEMPSIIDPVPQRVAGFNLPAISDDDQFCDLLRAIRDVSLDKRWQVEFVLPDIFALATGASWKTALIVINEWALTDDNERILAATRLLRGATPEFMFEHIEFIGRLLDHVAARPEEVRAGVEHNLTHSAISGSRTRTVGSFKGFDRDLMLLERSSDTLETITPGTASYSFFSQIHARAEESIRHEQQKDEEEFG